MALIVMIVRKMIKNKWLEISLLLGLVITVALVSSIPVYTNAILQRMLLKDLENLQKTTQDYPGMHYSGVYIQDEAVKPADRGPLIERMDRYMLNQAGPSFTLPIQSYVRERGTLSYDLIPVDPTKVDATIRRSANVASLSDLQNHIKLIDGRLPSKQPVNGVYEALVTDNALTKLKMVLNDTFTITDKDSKKSIKIMAVGVFDKKDPADVYWSSVGMLAYNKSFLIDFDLFESDITSNKVLPVKTSFWHYALDYKVIDLKTAKNFQVTSNWIDSVLASHFTSYSTKAPAVNTISKYFDREQKLRVMVWSLSVPVLLLLGFYLFMVANLITNRQKTEIAVLRSRGASRTQIMAAYIFEGILLGIIAFLSGPYVGLIFTKLLGSSNGFLEFVQRAALTAKVDGQTFKYALYAVVSSLIMTLIPAFIATGTSIVGHKQTMARSLRSSFWHRFYLDIIFIAVSLYGLNNFYSRSADIKKLSLDALSVQVDPLMFLIPALFMLGAGLLLLRVYPWFLRLIYWIGRKWWPPSLYSTLIQVGRSSTQYQFLMIFLIITLATGLYSASAARTINSNTEDKIRYANGADMAFQVAWENDAPPPPPPGAPAAPSSNTSTGTSAAPKKVQFTEPPFARFASLPGVEHATKVFIKPDAQFSMNNISGNAELMGIDTDEFGKTVWFRDHLLSHHLFSYLNLIAGDPSAVLISRSMATEQGLKPGDHIFVGWNAVDSKSFTVYGIIDYFPSFNPNPQPNMQTPPKLIVGHLQYIQNNLALEPYETWLKLKPDANRQALNQYFVDKGIPTTKWLDTREELRAAKNDPFEMAINGVMTLGFLISVLISFFGFLLYWILSLYSRILQLGIFRAMGISFRQMIGMLVAEQLLTSGAALLIGSLVGYAASQLFVPLFQLSFSMTDQVPPFRVTNNAMDSVSLYSVVLFMIALGLFILGFMLSRIKIHQAVKLGED